MGAGVAAARGTLFPGTNPLSCFPNDGVAAAVSARGGMSPGCKSCRGGAAGAGMGPRAGVDPAGMLWGPARGRGAARAFLGAGETGGLSPR